MFGFIKDIKLFTKYPANCFVAVDMQRKGRFGIGEAAVAVLQFIGLIVVVVRRQVDQ
jgi:hypothetical protein